MALKKLDKEFIVEKLKENWTDEAIGHLFGISRQAVSQFRKRWDIKTINNRCFERNREILRLREAGTSIKAIANKFDRSVFQIYRIIRDERKKM